MQSKSDQINAQNVPYNPILQNSNSFVNDLIEAAGLTPTLPLGADGKPVWAPAFDNDIDLRPGNSGNFYLDIASDWYDHAINTLNQSSSSVISAIEQFLQELNQTTGDWIDDLGRFFNNSTLRPNLDPLILDLNNDGIVLKSMAASGVFFDMDNDGAKERTGWLTRDDGFLAIDENNNGIIDNVGELIGDPGRSGFAELATYDSNADGQINSADVVWSRLRIWRDLDEDGVTDAGELQTLAANGVAAVSTNFTTVNFTTAENLIHEQGFYQTTGGAQRRVIDAWMQTDSVNTLGSSAPPSAAAAALPDIRGYGALNNLHQAMTANATLLAQVGQFVILTPSQFDQVEGRVEAIMMSWAGAGSIDPASRGGFFDARKLAVLEAVTGTPWVQQFTNPPVTNPPQFSVANLERAYDLLIDQFTARFLAVGPLKSTLDGTLYSTAADTLLALQPFDDYVAAVDARTPVDAQQQVFYWAESIKALRALGESNGLTASAIDTELREALTKYGLGNVLTELDTQLIDLRAGSGGALTLTQRQVVLLGSGADLVTLSYSGGAIFSAAGNDFVSAAGTYSSVTLSGGAGNDTLIGSSTSDFLDGGTGIDWMDGGSGDDTYVVDNASDVVIERAGTLGGYNDEIRTSISMILQNGIEHLTLLGTQNLTGRGNDSNNTMVGNAGRNVFYGGNGSDTYVIGANDIVVEYANEGTTDKVQVSGTYTLGAHIEQIELLGTGNFDATGNSRNNVLWGNAGNNKMIGGFGQDAMYGRGGNDIYYFTDPGDQAYENANEGTDLVYAWVDVYLNSYIENVTLVGDEDLTAYGNSLANSMLGNAADNTIDGQQGADYMAGGLGNDRYTVDDLSDRTVEAENSGYDTVTTGLAVYGLQTNIEELIYNGPTAVFRARGNASDNKITGGYAGDFIYGGAGKDQLFGGYGDVIDTLYGEAGDDYLDGGQGADVMVGGDGNDFYVVDNANDRFLETATGGIDTIQINTSIFTLDNNIENVEIADGGAWDVNGNAFSNVITGNSSSNVIDGQGGADVMSGRGGNDIYLVDVAGDRIFEFANEGEDLVKSFVSFALGDAVENLTLLGTTAIYASGNNLDNDLVGNSLNNIIVGGRGYDVVTGGAGRDTFVFQSFDGTYDRVTDFTLGATGDIIDVSKLMRSIGYTGNNPFNDSVLRTSNYGTDSAGLEVNLNPSGNGVTDWRLLAIVTGVGVTAANLASSSQIVSNGTANAAPFVLNPVEDQFVDIGEQMVVVLDSNVAEDFDSEVLTWNATALNAAGQAVALPSWLAFSPHVPALFGTADATSNDVVVRLTVSDERGASASFTMDVEVIRPDLGDQSFIGTEAAEVFVPGNGDDIVKAGGGNDTIRITIGNTPGETTDGNDRFDGGTGFDTLDLSATSAPVRIDLINGLATGTTIGIDEIAGFERVYGSSGNDTIIGSHGNDILAGLRGVDTMYGGRGDDIFLFGGLSQGWDRITDFNPIDDTLQLIGSGYGGGLAAGTDLATTNRFVSNTTGIATATIGQFVYDSDDGRLYWDIDGTGSVAKTLLLVLDKNPIVTVGNFDII